MHEPTHYELTQIPIVTQSVFIVKIIFNEDYCLKLVWNPVNAL